MSRGLISKNDLIYSILNPSWYFHKRWKPATRENNYFVVCIIPNLGKFLLMECAHPGIRKSSIHVECSFICWALIICKSLSTWIHYLKWYLSRLCGWENGGIRRVNHLSIPKLVSDEARPWTRPSNPRILTIAVNHIYQQNLE